MSFKIVFQGSIIVLVFAYIALGPYASYYQQVIDQLRTPVEIVFRAVSNAVYDVWLLATNPTEWYARQQVLNARPEKPIDFPKGVEVVSLDALPPSVPGGQPFAITTVISNQGFLEARNVMFTAECNQWCKISSLEVRPGELTTTPDGTPATIVKARMDRGESEIVTLSPFTAQFFKQRAAQTNLAKVKINISYTSSTNSSLQVSVISDGELEKRFKQGDVVFKPVTAVSKSTPAQLSLNVGPQPLKQSNFPTLENPSAINKALLLISVSNTRDHSKVILPRGTKIIVRVPMFLIDNPQNEDSFTCGQFKPIGRNGENNQYYNEDYSTIVYTVEPSIGQNSVEILAYEFNSIFAFICNFDVARLSNDDTIKTGLITAELPDYIFRAEQTKDVPITPPLGILFDPFEQTCNTCGSGSSISIPYAPDVPNVCDIKECHDLSSKTDADNKCWRDDNLVKRLTPGVSVCHSCGPKDSRDCSIFDNSPDACKTEASQCGLNCQYEFSDKANPYVDGIPVGRCVEAAKVTGEVTVAGQCTNVQDTYRTSYDKYSSTIASAIQTYGLKNYVQNPEALVAAIITWESEWDERAVGPGGDYGLMQIHVSVHPECDTAKIMNFDTTENINCGVRLLSQIAKDHNINTPKTYACNGVQYSGIDAILRYYNGWPEPGKTECNGDPGYVTKVKNGKPGATYSDWLACFQATTTTTTLTCSQCVSSENYWCTTSGSPSNNVGQCVGQNSACPQQFTYQVKESFVCSNLPAKAADPNYCANKLATSQIACNEYEGGCTREGDCANIAAGPNPPQRLTCRTGVTNVGICCYPTDSDATCLQNFNQWLNR